jgi:hypothetical protein
MSKEKIQDKKVSIKKKQKIKKKKSTGFKNWPTSDQDTLL